MNIFAFKDPRGSATMAAMMADTKEEFQRLFPVEYPGRVVPDMALVTQVELPFHLYELWRRSLGPLYEGGCPNRDLVEAIVRSTRVLVAAAWLLGQEEPPNRRDRRRERLRPLGVDIDMQDP